MKKIKAACTGISQRVSNFIDYCIFEFPTPASPQPAAGKACMRCNRNCDTGYFVISGHSVRLCSEKCYSAMYERFEKYQEALGKKECKLSGCYNKCYITIDGFVYDFCGQSHATLYEQQFPQNKICKLPGCSMPCFVESSGQVHDFCNKTHAEEFNYFHNCHKHHGHSHLANSQGPIYFYNRGEPYYEFTNFAMYKVWIDGKTWPTTEHYFQAQKFVGTPYVQAICDLATPREAFDFTRIPEVHFWCRSDWEQVKEGVMKKALRAKFTQHNELYLKLLNTRNRELVEHTSNDKYWGDGGDGSGKNRLGYLLMSVREELRHSQ